MKNIVDWDAVREALGLNDTRFLERWETYTDIQKQVLVEASQYCFEKHQDDPLVQALKRFVVSNIDSSLNKVASWYIPPTEEPLKPFLVRLRDGRCWIGMVELAQGRKGMYDVERYKIERFRPEGE